MTGDKIKTVKILVMSILFLLINTSCYAARVNGPYRGKIIDADTREPIEGVVVLGVWYKIYPHAAGHSSEFYDAMETVTDKNGEFKIQGLGLKILSNVEPMYVVIFKAGYEHLGLMMWVSLKEDILLSKTVKWEGDKAIIPLKKLTMEERRKRHADKETIPDKKQRLLIKELNKEYKKLGIPLYPEEN